jgi:hypothetical protein
MCRPTEAAVRRAFACPAQIIGRNSLSPLSYAQDSGLLEDASSSNGWQAARLQLPPLWVDLVDKVRVARPMHALKDSL